MFWFMEGMCFLPTFLVIWASSTFIISYIIAVLKGHVDVNFPYISATGADPPESGIFGLMATITAFTSICTMFARYKYVQKLQEVVANPWPRLNLATLWCGLASCLGMCIVGTFQVTLVQRVHDVGAVLFFVLGVTYIILQSFISYLMHPYGSSRPTCLTRAVISAVCVLAAFPMIFCGLFLENKQRWDPHDKDFNKHIASSICEWIVAFGFIIFFLSYIHDFKGFTLTLSLEMLASN